MLKIDMHKTALAAALFAAAFPAFAAAPAQRPAAAKTAAPAAKKAPDTAPIVAPAPVKMACPVGGKEFEYRPSRQAPVAGERPDGKPYASVKFPLALPECPDNGLILYKEYDAAEVVRLEPLVASEAYQALRKAETPYYRAYWLMREMGVEPARHLWALLQASWEAEGKPELRARYLRELAEASAKVPAQPADLNWLGMEGRAVNALRELGRFDEAAARLDKIPLDTLTAGDPKRPDKTRQAWLDYFAGLRATIERKDASLEPADMIPARVAARRCGKEGLGEHDKAFCDRLAAEELKKVAAPREQSGR
jgi:hypothetical protein